MSIRELFHSIDASRKPAAGDVLSVLAPPADAAPSTYRSALERSLESGRGRNERAVLQKGEQRGAALESAARSRDSDSAPAAGPPRPTVQRAASSSRTEGAHRTPPADSAPENHNPPKGLAAQSAEQAASDEQQQDGVSTAFEPLPRPETVPRPPAGFSSLLGEAELTEVVADSEAGATEIVLRPPAGMFQSLDVAPESDAGVQQVIPDAEVIDAAAPADWENGSIRETAAAGQPSEDAVSTLSVPVEQPVPSGVVDVADVQPEANGADVRGDQGTDTDDADSAGDAAPRLSGAQAGGDAAPAEGPPSSDSNPFIPQSAAAAEAQSLSGRSPAKSPVDAASSQRSGLPAKALATGEDEQEPPASEPSAEFQTLSAALQSAPSGSSTASAEVETSSAENLTKAGADDAATAETRTAAAPTHPASAAVTSGRETGASARTETSHAVPTQDPQAFAERTAELVRGAHQSQQPLRVRLHPPELGALQVEVSLQRGGVHAHFEVTTLAAQQTLLENMSLLRESLAQNGTVVDRIEVHFVEPQSAENEQQDQPTQQHGRQSQNEPHGGGRQEGWEENGDGADRDSDAAESPASGDRIVSRTAGGVLDQLDLQV